MSGYPNARTLGSALIECPPWLEKAIERFHTKYVVEESGCWAWLGGTDGRGYGHLSVLGRNFSAHRFSREVFDGKPLRTDRVLDHLCRNRRCVNPEHVEQVTQAVNISRGLSGSVNAAKTHCPYGHEYTADNTYVIPATGGRTCRTCAHRRQVAYRLARAG